jgi:ferredoxin, 2Fe-2S
MVKIVIENLARKEVVVNDCSKSVLGILHGQGIDWMHACGGKGRCTTCKMIVVEGPERLSPMTAAEHDYLRQGAIKNNERLACQVKVLGDVVVQVPDEGKLPHVIYDF